MIRRAEQRPAQAASRDVRKITFEWFRLRDLDRVKIIARVREGRPFQNAAIRSDSSIFAELKKLQTFRHREPNVVALWFFQEQPGQGENGIGNRRGFHLRDDIVERLLVRKKTDGYGKRLDPDFGPRFPLTPRIGRAPGTAVAIGTLLLALRLARASPLALAPAISRPIMTAPTGLRVLALKIRVVIRTRRLVGPRG